MVVIAVSNQKGGVGKTDLSVNLASALAGKKKVVLVDLDPQSNSTDYLTSKKPKLSTADLLLNENVSLDDIIQKTEINNLFIAPAHPSLSTVQVQLMNDVGMQFKLKNKLKGHKFDYVIIDTQPSLGALTINALTAADEVLIPLQVHYFAMDGVANLVNTIKTIKQDINKKLEIGGVVLTMFDKRNRLSFEVEKMVRTTFGKNVFETTIPINVKLAEAPSHHKPILLYAPNSRGAKAYQNLAREFVNGR